MAIRSTGPELRGGVAEEGPSVVGASRSRWVNGYQLLSTWSDRVAKAVEAFVRWGAVAAIVTELLATLVDVVGREAFNRSVQSAPAISQVSLLVLAFFGGALAYREGRSIHLDFLIKRCGETGRQFLSAAAAAVVGWISWEVILWLVQSYGDASTASIPGLNLSQGVLALVASVGMVCVLVFAAAELLRHPLKIVIRALPVLIAVIALAQWLVMRASVAPMSAGEGLTISVVVGILLMVSGVPLAFAIILVSLLYAIATGTPMGFVTLSLEGGLADHLLLTIPFFVLAGYLMTAGGLARAIVAMLSPVLERLPGGLLQLAVGSTFVFSGMSGAKIADVAAVGATLDESLERGSYDRGEAASVLAASAAAGETIPPSIAMLLLGSITSVSISTLFVAGIVPALVLGLGISALVAIRARIGKVRNIVPASAPRSAGPARRRSKIVTEGLVALGLPVALIGGIESGVVTPTEVSALAVCYALVASVVVGDRLSVRSTAAVMAETASMSGLLLILVTAAHAFAGSAALAGLPQWMAEATTHISSSPSVFLIISVLLLPIVGAFLEGIPAILIFGPLFLPAAQNLGIDPVHYSVVFILAMGTGAFSPLLGVGFYTACSVIRADVRAATRRFWPYFGALLVANLLVAFTPSLSLWLPHLVGH